MNKYWHLLIFALIAVCAAPLQTGAYVFTGRVSSDLYAYQNSTQDHIRPYLRFRGNMLAWRSPNGRVLRLHTSLRWTTDLADKLPTDPSLFVYDAYVHLSKALPWTDVYLGRQFVYSGAGSALLDGGRIHFRRNKNYNLNIFGGSSVSSLDPEQVRSLGDNLVLGGRFSARPHKDTRLGLSWMSRRRDGQQSYHRVGLDVDQYLGRANIFGRVAYNAASLRLAEILARAAIRPGAWYFSGEYHRREPLVPSHSIFSLIDFETYQIARAEARRRVWRAVSVVAHVQTDITSSDDTWRTGLGFVAPFLSLTWIHQTGYGGDNNGVSGYVNRTLSRQFDLYASANLYRYRVQREQTDHSDAYASTAGVRWRPGSGITVKVEGQYLRNAVLKDDGRFLLRIAKDFSVRSNEGETVR